MNARHLRPASLTMALLFTIGGAAGATPCAAAAAAAATAPQQFEGILEVAWGDPHPTLGSDGGMLFSLVLEDGTRLPLRFDGNQSVALQHFGRRVVVSGQVLEAAAASAPSRRSMLVQAIAAAANAPAEPQTVSGTKRVLFLLLKFADDTAVPHPPAFYTNMTNPDTPPEGEVFPTTINGFFRKTSANQFSWNADVGGTGGVPATDWLTLPFPKSHYAPCGWGEMCADLGALSNDGMAAGAAQGIDFGVYDNVNFVLSNDLDCCAWGGGFVYGDKSYGATWEPPWGQNTSTYAHEMGHSIGLPHSGWLYYAYDSPWDVMSSIAVASSLPCGTYFSANNNMLVDTYCSEPGDGYITAHKDFLGWMSPANIVVTDASSTLTVELEGAALPAGDATKMIRVCLPCEPCTGPAAHYLTVEARVYGLGPISQFDNGLPGEGVLIHDVRMDRPAVFGPCFFNSQSGWAMPVDATPGDWDEAPSCSIGNRWWPDFALFNAQWLAGQTYTDPTKRLEIEVLSREGSSYVVSVRPCTGSKCVPWSGRCGCGDGILSEPEECDDGDDRFVPGEYCGPSCLRVPCGMPMNGPDDTPRASDALFTLRAAVGQLTCSVRVCDVNTDANVTATDALMILRVAVGDRLKLACPL